MINKIILLATSLFTALSFAQAPQKMSYQAVIRNSSNTLVSNAPVGIKVSILQGSTSGTAVFAETHTVTTNTNGLATLSIGAGANVSGSMGAINWGANPFFIKTETDPTGGTNYSITATSELLSVPYALYASNSAPGPQGPAGPQGGGVVSVTSLGGPAAVYNTTNQYAFAGPTTTITVLTGDKIVVNASIDLTSTGTNSTFMKLGLGYQSSTGVQIFNFAGSYPTTILLTTRSEMFSVSGTTSLPAGTYLVGPVFQNLTSGDVSAASSVNGWVMVLR